MINKVSATLTPVDLIELNARSVNEKLPAERIASDWLKEKEL